ncbi:hypothetical protein [Acidovorax sp. Leaf191]|uniref:hypothetical protein n=1 Tax=Acidovorax sp. Leaf191 TaxID=1736296 RepID=UPI0012E2E8A7|nr:hypothetical protein [Acidovorax sp. Leaf191]
MRRKSLRLCWMLLLGAGIAAPVVWAQVPLPHANEAAPSLKEPLERAVAQTPYSALVIHTRVDIEPVRPKKGASAGQDEYTEERTVYHARVLETFRGNAVRQVRYEVWGERGESAVIDSKPQILTLCSGPRGFYWPGTGASFPADPELLVLARRVGREAAAGSSHKFVQCH